ncbi:efflux RND transporter periplasmic adaptor subunit [Nostoc sp.]|uniref:efflux RND transporter periplasmic adaptor subunit n=1 Tax=Nostoc sp. TaxID=1180 RepID=UPI002FF6E8CC
MPPKLLKKAGCLHLVLSSPNILTTISLFILLIGCQGKDPPTDEAAAVSLPVVNVQRQDIPVEVNIGGMVSAPPNTSAKVSPTVAGKLAVVTVVPGQKVAKGQLIARLDNRQSLDQLNQATAGLRSAQAGVAQAQINLELAQKSLERSRRLYNQALNPTQKATDPGILGARAGVAQAQSNLAFGEKNLQRQKILFKKGVSPKKDLFAAQNQLETAQAALVTAQTAVQQVVPQKDVIAAQSQVETSQVALAGAIAQQEQAKASRDLAQTQLSFTDIFSPISGVVATRFLNNNDTTDPATPIIQVVNLSKVIVNANLPADKKANIRVSQSANIRSLTGGSYSGIVTAISPIVDPQSNTRSIQISVNNSQTQLRENQAVTISIITEIHSAAITVPQTALVPDPDTPTERMVYTVKAGKLERKKVKTGIQQGDLSNRDSFASRVEILSGLMGNERVVAKGAYGLADGTAIQEVKQ